MHKILTFKGGIGNIIKLKFHTLSLRRNLRNSDICEFKLVLWLDKSLEGIAVRRFQPCGVNYDHSGNGKFYISYASCYRPIHKILKSCES